LSTFRLINWNPLFLLLIGISRTSESSGKPKLNNPSADIIGAHREGNWFQEVTLST